MVETVVVKDLLKRIECAKWNLVRVSSLNCVDFLALSVLCACVFQNFSAQMNYQTIGITVAAVSFVIFVSCFIFFFRRQRQKRGMESLDNLHIILP
jgi:uncharacterized membrane protein YoaT (DUF817 family)